MSTDALIVNPGRLKILTALASQPTQEFVQLRVATRLTDGNLATHARRLHSAGLVDIDKTFRQGKPVTTYTLTLRGRDALREHVGRLVAALQEPSTSAANVSPTPSESQDDSDWID